jgi:hypothetical protein
MIIIIITNQLYIPSSCSSHDDEFFFTKRGRERERDPHNEDFVRPWRPTGTSAEDESVQEGGKKVLEKV